MFVALSYVWGTRDADKEDWPRTVPDAVAVTKELGLRYIWVDRLCINQADDDETAYLISKITTIYEEAELTIVAAAGSGAKHGLPGVRSTSRTPQPKYTLDGGNTLLYGLPLWLGRIAGFHSGAQITFALTVSAWHHRTSQHKTFVSESCRRRMHLPSWSWAGWTDAAVSWRALPNNEHCAQMAGFIELPPQQHDSERIRLL
jgi:hypothetical protein